MNSLTVTSKLWGRSLSGLFQSVALTPIGWQRTEVTVFHLALADPTDYAAILRLRARLLELLEMCAGGCLYIATASGTPQMHACWLLLASWGQTPLVQ